MNDGEAKSVNRELHSGLLKGTFVTHTVYSPPVLRPRIYTGTRGEKFQSTLKCYEWSENIQNLIRTFLKDSNFYSADRNTFPKIEIKSIISPIQNKIIKWSSYNGRR